MAEPNCFRLVQNKINVEPGRVTCLGSFSLYVRRSTIGALVLIQIQVKDGSRTWWWVWGLFMGIINSWGSKIWSRIMDLDRTSGFGSLIGPDKPA